jgi:hypothetical protein
MHANEGMARDVYCVLAIVHILKKKPRGRGLPRGTDRAGASARIKLEWVRGQNSRRPGMNANPGPMLDIKRLARIARPL